MSSYSIKIISYELASNKVVYTVVVTCGRSSSIKFKKYRYSQLKQIHNKLQQMISQLNLQVQLPDFPGRRLFGVTNKSEEAINERKNELENYLVELIKIQKLYMIQIFKASFLPEEPRSPTLKNNSLNVEMFIDRYTIMDEVVIYFMRIKDIETTQEWNFKSRYSDLRNVHQALEKSKVNYLPEFPKRKLFGITRDNYEDIEKRKEELERYFNEVLSLKELTKSQAIKYFIEDSKKQSLRQESITN